MTLALRQLNPIHIKGPSSFFFSRVSLFLENSPRLLNFSCTSFNSIFASSSSVVRHIYFVWQISILFRISSKGNFRPVMDISCVIILPSLIAILVKFCGTSIWPRLYFPCSILSFRIFMTCWFHFPTGKDISLQIGILNLNLEKIEPLTCQASKKEFLKWNSCKLLLSDFFAMPQKSFMKVLETFTKTFWNTTKKWEDVDWIVSTLCPRMEYLRVNSGLHYLCCIWCCFSPNCLINS